MPVFAMNDLEKVYANSQHEAIDYYVEMSGFSEKDVKEDFIGEVDLQDTMLISLSDEPSEEEKGSNLFEFSNGEWYKKVTFDWVIQNEQLDSPCIISVKGK